MEYFQLFMVLGILIGNALAVIIPYLRKLAEGKIKVFDYKYLYHAVISAVWQSAVSMPLWLDWGSPSGISWVLSFILAIAFGFGGKDFQEQVLKYIRKEAVTVTPVTPPA